MNKSRIGRIIGTSTILYIAMSISTVLHAGYITGQFSLVQDHDKHGIDQGELVASVTFTADDTTRTIIQGHSVFDVIRLELIDRTSDLDIGGNGDSLIGNFLYVADLMAMPAGTATMTNPLKAFYSPTGTFVGIDGSLAEGNWMTGRIVAFSVQGTTVLEPTAVSYNMQTHFGDSWAQVPEPSALALLGIGLAGFGVVRLRGLRG